MNNITVNPPVNGESSVTAQRWDNQSLLTKKQLAERLQLSRRSVESLMKLGAIPFFRLPKNILRFRWSDVATALRKFEENALPELGDLTELELLHGRTISTLRDQFAKIVSSVFRGRQNDEVFLKPAELLEIARSVGAFAWILNTEVSSSADLSDKSARSERTGFGRQCEKVIGHSFSDGVRFDSTGDGHTKRYRFTRPGRDKELQS
jgi:hypothetical protein